MEVTEHLDLKKFQSSLLLQIQLLNAGTGIQRYGNLENQRSAHRPCPNKPLNCQNTLCPAKQSRNTPWHLDSFGDRVIAPHTMSQGLRTSWPTFTTFHTLQLQLLMLHLKSAGNLTRRAMHYQSLLCTSNISRDKPVWNQKHALLQARYLSKEIHYINHHYHLELARKHLFCIAKRFFLLTGWHTNYLTSRTISAASWRQRIKVPTRVKLVTYEKEIRVTARMWCVNMIPKS